MNAVEKQIKICLDFMITIESVLSDTYWFLSNEKLVMPTSCIAPDLMMSMLQFVTAMLAKYVYDKMFIS